MPEAKLDVIVDPSGAISGSSQAKQAINSINDSTRKMAAEMEKARQAQERINAATQRMVGAIRAAGTAWLVYKGVMNTYIRNSMEAERASTQLDAVLKSTKSAAGLTAVEIKNMASEMQMLTAFGDDEVISMQNLLLTFKQIKGDTFKQATMAVLDLSTAMGMDLKSAAIQVGKALNDPKIGLTMLQRVGITFSESQKEMIKNFLKTGELAKAQKIILKELESQFGGSAKAATNNFGGAIQQLKNKFGDLFEINATGEFNEMTVAVKELTKTLDTKPVQEFTQELGKLIANGIEEATNALKTMAENVDTVKAAIVGLSGLKLSKAVLAFLGLSGGTAGAISVGIGGIAFGAFKNKQLADEQLKDIRLLESAGEIPLGSLGKGYTGKQLKEMVSGLSSSEWASNSLGAIRALEGTNLGKIPKLKPTPYSGGGGGSSKSKSKSGKTAAEEALERIKIKAQEAGEAVAAALSRLEAQNTALEEAKSAATEGEQRYYDSLRWENQEGLLGDTEYLDILKKRFADLSTELEGLGLDMQNVSNWSDPMRATFSEIQSVVGGLATDTMDLLQRQFESGTLTNAQYLSALEAIKTKFAEYPSVVKLAEEAIQAFNLSAQASLPTVAGQVQSAWNDMNMAIAKAPSAIGDAFVSAIRGAENLGDAMRNLLQDIGAVIAKALIMKYIVGPIMGFADGGLVGSVGTPASAVGLDNWVSAKSIFGRGGVFDSGQLTAFANGGIVNKPTLFPFASGVGLMGEAGAEAIMPLKRTSSGDLGVQADGGGGTTNITMNINAVDSRSFVEMMRTNRASVESIVVENIMRNGAVRGAIRGMA